MFVSNISAYSMRGPTRDLVVSDTTQKQKLEKQLLVNRKDFTEYCVTFKKLFKNKRENRGRSSGKYFMMNFLHGIITEFDNVI
jgi:hypothetical protein